MSPDKGLNLEQPQSIADILLSSAAALASRLEADLLLCLVLGCERAWLYAHAEDRPDRTKLEQINALVKERRRGVPIAQLLGEREFYGRRFQLDENVLIPRPESELLVELALSLDLPAEASVVDLGTGSGCIALSLAAERRRWKISAVDCSAQALKVAALNRQELSLDHVELVQGNLLDELSDRRFDLIVSNPPYVSDTDPHLERGDLRFEPRLALTAGDDGLDVIRRLIPQAMEHLSAGGWLLIEHGHDQAPAVVELFIQAGFESPESHRDLAGIERVTTGRKQALPKHARQHNMIDTD